MTLLVAHFGHLRGGVRLGREREGGRERERARKGHCEGELRLTARAINIKAFVCRQSQQRL